MHILKSICTALFFFWVYHPNLCSAANVPEHIENKEIIEAQVQFFGYQDGLIDGVVRAISQAPDGAMWFGGKKGIARYDGIKWQTFTLDHLPILADINDIHADTKGMIWIATAKGLARFDYPNNTWQSYTEEDGLPGPCVNTICETQNGTLWIGCGTLYWLHSPPSGGAAFWNGTTWQSYDTSDGLVQEHVNDIIEADDATLWFATDGGVSHFNHQTWTSYTETDGLLTNVVRSILQDQDGALWFGTADTTRISAKPNPNIQTGISKFQNQTWENFPLKSHKWGVRSIYQTQDGTIWAWVGSALYQYKNNQWVNYPIPLPDGSDYTNLYVTSSDVMWLPGQNIVRFNYHPSKRQWMQYKISGPPYEDTNGDLWFGNPAGGSLKFDGKSWHPFSNIELPIYRAPDSTLWTSSKNGIQTYKHQKPLASYPQTLDRIIRIYPAKTGLIWFIGSHQDTSTVVVYNPQTNAWKKYTDKDWGTGITLDQYLKESPEGDMWFKTLFANRLDGDGLIQFDGQQWHHHRLPTLEANRIYGLEIDLKGQIWAGTLDGLWVFNHQNWKRVIPENKKKPADIAIYRKVTRIHQAQDKSIWISCADKATTQAGIYQYKDGYWRAFTRAHGLPTNNYWYIYETLKGKMWFASFGSVSGFDGATWSHYKNNLFLNKTHFIFQAAQDTTRPIWIGRNYTSNSNQWWTVRLSPDKTPPTTQIIFPNSPQATARNFIPPQGHLLISWEGQDPWNITPSNLLTYSWQIDNSNWSPFSHNIRQAFFNLSQGSHTFRVKAKDHDGNVDLNPAEFSFWVLPPTWKQPWFVGLMAILLGTIAYLSARTIKHGHDLSNSNKALSDANKQLYQVNQTLTSEISERERLDTQIKDLQFLYALRASLGEKRTPQEVIEAVGNALVNVLGPEGSIVISLDDHTLELGNQNAQYTYNRTLSWGERDRGTLKVFSPISLSESQERTLLDETTGQLTRVLESRELQMQLLQSARLVSLGQMAAGVAHELNQPLGGISATAEDYYLRLQDNMSVSNEQLTETFKRILGMVDRMSNTVEHLRIFSRDTSQEPGKPLNLNDVIQSSLDIIGTQLKNHSIDVKLELAPELPQMIGHPYQVEQIFLNLLGNARDALDAQTTSNFKTITISTHQKSDTIIAKVQDNGAGIDPEHLNRIFEPFYTTKPADKGTGLGLSITYAIVKNHGGNITCTSNKDKGTTFEVTFPISQPNT